MWIMPVVSDQNVLEFYDKGLVSYRRNQKLIMFTTIWLLYYTLVWKSDSYNPENREGLRKYFARWLLIL